MEGRRLFGAGRAQPNTVRQPLFLCLIKGDGQAVPLQGQIGAAMYSLCKKPFRSFRTAMA